MARCFPVAPVRGVSMWAIMGCVSVVCSVECRGVCAGGCIGGAQRLLLTYSAA